jgi:hypothetical protein
MKPLVLLIATAMILSALNLRAQTIHFAVITLDTKASVSGFLHSVNDTAVVIVPGYRKKDVARLNFVEPVAIPIKTIKRVVSWKVQGSGTILLQVAAIAALSTSTTYLAVEKLGAQWGLPGSFVMNMAVIFSHTQLVTKRLSPTDLFFREKIEDRCIYKDERSLIASSSQTAMK